MNVSVRELKNHLSEYLRRVAAGEEVIVVSRGRHVARLAPVRGEATPEDREAEALARLDALPWVTPGRGGKPKGARKPIAARRGECLSAKLLERE